MSKNNIILASVIGFIAFIGIALFFKNIQVDNAVISKKTAIEAKITDQEMSFDKMTKVIVQKAGVSAEYAKTFIEIMDKVSERYSNDQTVMMKWIVENNPQFDASLYKDLMQSIESERNSFLSVQRTLVDMCAKYNEFIQIFPNSMFVNDATLMKPTIITSARAKQAALTGEDNEVDLFPKK